MPAIITHHLFAEDAAHKLPNGILHGEEDTLAFVLGSQGTDPFFTRWRTLPHIALRCHAFAHEVHASEPVAPLLAARNATAHLPEEDKHVGRALTLGLLAHYVLDSIAHPFVYAMQNQLVEADPELSGAYTELHGMIESDIDSWMLWNYRHTTILETPAYTELAHTERIGRVGGALFSQVALQRFDIELPPTEYAHALNDYELLYRLIDPASSKRCHLLASAERLARPHSLLQEMAHLPSTDEDSASLNLEHHGWKDPSTGVPSQASFPDLYFDALDSWPAMAEALVRGDARQLKALSGGLNYSGQPVDAAVDADPNDKDNA